MPTFGEILRHDREKLQLSQEQLAKMLDVSQQAVANWEAGAAHPRRDRRARLLQILGSNSELARNPPRTDFLPTIERASPPVIAKPTPPLTRDEAVARWEDSQRRIMGLIERAQVEHADLRDALPERLRQHLNGKIAVGAAARGLDYLSPRLAVEIKRMPGNKFFTWQQFAPPMLHLAVARNMAQAVESKREFLLIVVNDTGATPSAQTMQRVMFDAGVLGIAVHQVPSFMAAGHLIDHIESEPPESEAHAEFTLGALTLDATGEADSDRPEP